MVITIEQLFLLKLITLLSLFEEGSFTEFLCVDTVRRKARRKQMV